ncbi:hypothetical protein [Novosphingopyxis sp.]|uniref:hypothetical protein n=1 Tax=Novosphingopyxis sp. TaxID=2709690 RepID=UPI003B5BE367
MSGAERVTRALSRRGTDMAARRVERRKALLAQIYGEALPDAEVSEDARGVTVRARRLRARLFADAWARWPGSWLR